MTEKNSKLLSIDVVYFVFSILLAICYFEARSIYDLMLLIIATIYYIRIKIYRWKKYH